MSAGEVIFTIAWMIADILLTVVLSSLLFLNSMNVAGCGPERLCNLDLAQASLFITPIAGGTAAVLTAVGGVAAALRERRMWVAPAVGVLIVVLGFATSLILNNAALLS